MLTLGKRWDLPRGCDSLDGRCMRSTERERDTSCCSLTFFTVPKGKKFDWLEHTEACQETLRCRWAKLFPGNSAVYVQPWHKKKTESVQVFLSLFCRIWIMKYLLKMFLCYLARDLNKIDDLMQDITEQQDVAQEISDAISNRAAFGDEFDEVSTSGLWVLAVKWFHSYFVVVWWLVLVVCFSKGVGVKFLGSSLPHLGCFPTSHLHLIYIYLYIHTYLLKYIK